MTRLAIVLTALALSQFAAPLAVAAPMEFFGITQGRLDDLDLQGMRNARVHANRFVLKWGLVQRSRGSNTWGSVDRFIGALSSHGIRPVPFVWGSPRWVRSGAARPPIDTAAHVQAWRDFLTAAVARYGPGGSYWANRYRQQYGAGAPRLPIRAWQVWNEPNLKKYFRAGRTVRQSARKYARLLRISHDTIKRQDPQAVIVLAGMPGFRDPTAWDFLDHLYSVPGFKGDFDAAAQHPYARNLDEFRREIRRLREVMSDHGDQATPLWLTELGWGSGTPNRFGVDKGPSGQRQMLSRSFRLILSHRSAWNVQRIFWFLWRDPAPRSRYANLCSFCGTAGLLNYDRTAKPTSNAFTSFTAETTPPQVSITSGPGPGSFTNDSTPSWSFYSNEAGSTFACRVDASSFKSCGSPLAPGSSLPDGTHTFYVKAIDAPGNESAMVSRPFTVDTTAPTVTISSGPADGSSSSDRNPSFSFASSEPGSRFQCKLDSGFVPCSSPYARTGLDNGRHAFRVRAIDAVGTRGDRRAIGFRVDTVAPNVRIKGPRRVKTRRERASVGFALRASRRVGLRCRIASRRFKACSSRYRTPRLKRGPHSLRVKATDRAGNVRTERKRFKIVWRDGRAARGR